jgi:inner membrane protein YidH
VPSLPDGGPGREYRGAVPEPPDSAEVPEFGDPSRRTYLASERTLLAWWRTSLGALGVALAVGRLLPTVAHLKREPFIALGVAWGVLACGLLVFGSWRERRGEDVIRSGGFLRLSPTIVSVFVVYTLALTVVTVVVSLWAS